MFVTAYSTLIIVEGFWLSKKFRQLLELNSSEKFEKGLDIIIYAVIFIFIDIVLLFAGLGET